MASDNFTLFTEHRQPAYLFGTAHDEHSLIIPIEQRDRVLSIVELLHNQQSFNNKNLLIKVNKNTLLLFFWSTEFLISVIKAITGLVNYTLLTYPSEYTKGWYIEYTCEDYTPNDIILLVHQKISEICAFITRYEKRMPNKYYECNDVIYNIPGYKVIRKTDSVSVIFIVNILHAILSICPEVVIRSLDDQNLYVFTGHMSPII